jgi:hypothetical protein
MLRECAPVKGILRQLALDCRILQNVTDGGLLYSSVEKFLFDAYSRNPLIGPLLGSLVRRIWIAGLLNLARCR